MKNKLKKFSLIAIILFMGLFFIGGNNVKAANTVKYEKGAEDASGSTSSTSLNQYNFCKGTLADNGFKRTGYTFSGWKIGDDIHTEKSNIQGNYNWFSMSCDDLTATAQWTPNNYKVNFDANANGVTSDPKNKNVTYDATYGNLPTPARTGYTLDGWYTAKSGGDKITSDTVVKITSETTLYAHWTANKYTLTLDANGGEVGQTSKEVTFGGKVGDLPTPTRTGYTFTGWYTSKTGYTSVNSNTNVSQANDVTLYAHWLANSFWLSFNAQGASNPNRVYVTYDSNYGTLSNPTNIPEGWTFNGWYTQDGTQIKKGDKVQITANTTVYAHWKYAVTTEVLGSHGKITEDADVVAGEDFVITFTPDKNYMINQVFVDGEEVTIEDNTYTLEDVSEPHKVQVSYKKRPFALVVICDDHATANPNGIVNVLSGDNQTIEIKANPGYILKSVKVDGEEIDLPLTGDAIILEEISKNTEVKIEVEKETYKVVEGKNQTVEKDKDLTVKFSGDWDLFRKLYINGELIDSKYYETASGSTIITLKKEYLANLKPGKYTLTAEYENGNTAETTFVIPEEKTENPKTSDNISLFFGAGLASIIGLAGAGLYIYKRRNN